MNPIGGSEFPERCLLFIVLVLCLKHLVGESARDDRARLRFLLGGLGKLILDPEPHNLGEPLLDAGEDAF